MSRLKSQLDATSSPPEGMLQLESPPPRHSASSSGMSPQPELILESSIVRSGAPTLILLSSMVSIEHPSPTIFDLPANRKMALDGLATGIFVMFFNEDFLVFLAAE
jgi:hypothetical protein